jgi:hypothetical protein
MPSLAGNISLLATVATRADSNALNASAASSNDTTEYNNILGYIPSLDLTAAAAGNPEFPSDAMRRAVDMDGYQGVYVFIALVQTIHLLRHGRKYMLAMTTALYCKHIMCCVPWNEPNRAHLPRSLRCWFGHSYCLSE